jgi:hypothetical protein
MIFTYFNFFLTMQREAKKVNRNTMQLLTPYSLLPTANSIYEERMTNDE